MSVCDVLCCLCLLQALEAKEQQTTGNRKGWISALVAAIMPDDDSKSVPDGVGKPKVAVVTATGEC